MASPGISRSGRVRKRSSKLIDMEIETPGHPSSDNHNKSGQKRSPNTPITTNTMSDSPTAPPKKNLKLKLTLNPSTAVAVEENINERETMRTTVPVLKIPKSKITGLTPKVEEEPLQQDYSDYEVTEEVNTEVIAPSEYEEELSVKEEEIDAEMQTTVSETKSEPTESPIKVENGVETVIEETPKPLKTPKPKKKAPESAANKLFRQITSGVATNSSTKSKGNKRKRSPAVAEPTLSTFEDEFSETSLVIETEDIKPKPKSPRSRPTKTVNDNKAEAKKPKRAKKETDDKPKKKRNAVITAYMIWSKEYRSKIQQDSPELDFADVSRKLGEIWQSMPEKEKIPWRRKAQKLITKGSSIISTGKPKAISQNTKLSNSLAASQLIINSDDFANCTSIEDLWEPIGTSPMDVSAHLTLLGESLTIIGQRLKEHSGQIAVSGSLSVLLDTTLCAIGPLLCLTQLHPSLDGCYEETHKKTLDNIAYIMPGI